MRIYRFVAALSILFMTLACGLARGSATPQILPSESVSMATDRAAAGSSALFTDASSASAPAAPANAARSRLVRINLGLLLTDDGQPRDLPAGTTITLNLFPDVSYEGVIERIGREGDGSSWTGHLQGVEYSALTMVYTGGVFIGHFASPLGVYEVSLVQDDLYRVILIDQSKFQGGEDYIDPTPASP